MALSGRDFVGIAQTGSGKTLGVSLNSFICIHICNFHVHVYTCCISSIVALKQE